jgi:redox-sensitive bicupin YhaK (pirin superfamily)
MDCWKSTSLIQRLSADRHGRVYADFARLAAATKLSVAAEFLSFRYAMPITSGGGRIGAGDLQWMTAGDGIVHEEFHSQDFTRKGGTLQMVQLWVNLRAKDKGARPGYQTPLKAQIPHVTLSQDAGTVRTIFARAGEGISVTAKTDVKLLVMDGEPIAEPVVGHGPFVMNGRAEIQQAFEDYQLGKMGEID